MIHRKRRLIMKSTSGIWSCQPNPIFVRWGIVWLGIFVWASAFGLSYVWRVFSTTVFSGMVAAFVTGSGVLLAFICYALLQMYWTRNQQFVVDVSAGTISLGDRNLCIIDDVLRISLVQDQAGDEPSLSLNVFLRDGTMLDLPPWMLGLPTNEAQALLNELCYIEGLSEKVE